jgi:hypothetical protein
VNIGVDAIDLFLILCQDLMLQAALVGWLAISPDDVWSVQIRLLKVMTPGDARHTS